MQTAQSINVTNSKGVGPMLGLNLHGWEHVMLLSLIFAGIAAVIVAFSTIMVVKLQRLEAKAAEEIFLQYKEDAGKEIAAAAVKAAEANARAAEANKIAEGERLARVKIEEKLAPRSITQKQIDGLSKRLKPYSGIAIDILQIGESPEITNFRSLIENPLRAAGLNIFSSTAVGSGSFTGLSVGVLIDANDSDKAAASALLSALNAEGVAASDAGVSKREDWPGFTMAPPGANKALIRMYVGSKP